jgi:hypothetical protein
VPAKAKSAEILCVFRAFLTQDGADKRLFRAIYPYGAPPKRGALLFDGAVVNWHKREVAL